jgi:hypothetical protein
MKTINIKEFETEFNKQGYKYLSLFTSSGEVLEPWNQHGEQQKAERLAGIKKRLTSSVIPDGVYVIRCKNSITKSVKADEYYVLKGKPETTDINIITPISERKDQPEKRDVIGVDEVIALKSEIARLSLENEDLTRRYDELIDEYDELISEFEAIEDDSEKKGGLGEIATNSKNFIKELAEIAVPVIDKLLNLKERELNIKEVNTLKDMGVKNDQVKNDQDKQQHNPAMTPEQVTEYWRNLAILETTDPERYSQIVSQINGGNGAG